MGLKELGTEHMIAIKYLSLPKKGGLTYQQIADECGVHVNTIDNWRKDALFTRELKKEMVKETLKRMPEALDSMMDAAIEDRSAAAMKLALQANDMITEKHEHVDTSKESKGIDAIKDRIAKLKSTFNKKEEE